MAFEIHVTIEAPAVCEAVNNLAAALNHNTPKAAANVAPVQQMAPAAPAVTTAPAAPVQPPVTTPVQQQTPIQFTAPAAPVVPPVNSVPAPTEVAQRQYTADEIARAGASLLEKGMMQQLVGLLGKYNVQSITGLQPAQYAAFAADLRTMGAQI